MNTANVEHVNVTVSDPEKTARMLCDIFGWKIRWHGEAINRGVTYHVGSDASYIAVYSSKTPKVSGEVTYDSIGGLNHIGIVVDDLDAIEKRVNEAGYTPHSHGDYEPGRRFYFHDHDNVEIEVVSYPSR